MKRPITSIGLICIVFGIGCLLVLHYDSAKASLKEKVPQTVPVVVNAVASEGNQIATTSEVVSTSLQDTQKQSDAVQRVGSITASVPMTYEVVKDTTAQERGLGGRASIPDNYAMVFVFPEDGMYGFWMKDMLTSIDMIWLSDTGTIVAIDSDVSPDTYPSVFYPPVPVKYVFETRAGFAKEKNWTIGTQVTLPGSVF